MKVRFTFLLLLATCFTCFCQTITVSGVQSGVWDVDEVVVTGDVLVRDSLTVTSGTMVLFDGHYSITIGKEAIFKALGTEESPIVFTVADTTGFYLYDSSKGGWNGLQIDKAGSVLFDHCVLEYGKAADVDDSMGGAMNIVGCDDVVIRNCTLRRNLAREHGGAVNAIDSHVAMTGCHVNENQLYDGGESYFMYGGGLRFHRCDVELSEMEFRGNYGPTCIGGALSLDSCSVMLDRAVFAENIGLNGGGLYIMRCNHLDCRLSNLLFDDNFSGHFGGGLAFLDASPLVYNMLVTNNTSEGVNCTGVFFYQYSSPILTNCIIYGNYPVNPSFEMDTVQMWLWTFDDCAPQFRNCLIERGKSHITGGDYIKVYEDIIEADPLFVDAEYHDFRLREESPCRDAGHVDVPEDLAEGFDLDGIRRVSNGRIDIGPYEYSSASVQTAPETVRAKLVGNPLNAKSHIVMDQELEGDVVVNVCSTTGSQIAQKVVAPGNSSVIEVGDLVDRLAPGVYLIEVVGKNTRVVLKAVR